MQKSYALYFKKRPSVISTALLALLGRRDAFYCKGSIASITAERMGVKIDGGHLDEFNAICGIESSEHLSLMYPFTLIYPLLQRILAHGKAPLSLFRALNSRMRVLQYRKINLAETLDIRCAVAEHRIRKKGLELDIESVIQSAGVPVWKNIQTFYFRGDFGPEESAYMPPWFDLISDAGISTKWYLPDRGGFRFAGISGDGNPIHYSKIYARLFGFKRDFAQPLLVLAGCIERLRRPVNEKEVSVDIALKGQIYYGNYLILKSSDMKDHTRFDIYSEKDSQPYIMGKIEIIG